MSFKLSDGNDVPRTATLKCDRCINSEEFIFRDSTGDPHIRFFFDGGAFVELASRPNNGVPRDLCVGCTNDLLEWIAEGRT